MTAAKHSPKVPFFRHDLGEAEVEAFRKVLAGPILTTGAVTAEFEQKFAAALGAKHALAVTSCTGALHMCLLGLGIGPGDEVIITPMTFIATATAIISAGATPVFVDVERHTGNLDAAAVEAAITPRTKAILPVHLYGLMCDMRALRAVADRHGLAIVEDAAHCIEGVRDGVRPGQLSNAACFSFYATKNMTCGEGGALVVNDGAFYEQLRLIRLHGMTKTAYDRSKEGYTHWDMVTMGWKYNMSNVDASILIPQLDRLQANLAKRHTLAARYAERLGKISGIELPRTPNDAVHARHVYPIWLTSKPRDEVLQALMARGIEVVVNYRAVHLLSYFTENLGCKAGDHPAAERLGDTTLSLPFYPNMPLEYVDIVAETLEEVLD